jgi:hypothetical protein
MGSGGTADPTGPSVGRRRSIDLVNTIFYLLSAGCQ